MGNIFIGANGNKKIKNAWIGTPQGSKKVKTIWIGTPQGNKKVWSAAFAFSYTGQYEVTGSLDDDFCITFLTNGVLTITSLGKADEGIDICCVAGGYKGGKATWDSYNYDGWQYHGGGGKGGNGGRVVNSSNVAISETSYSIVIGAMGGGASSFGNLASASGAGAAGGNGGNTNQAKNLAVRGADGTYAFNDANMQTKYPAGTRFGAGGGGGAGWWNHNVYSRANGGATGGGNGGVNETVGNAATIPGSGGGGGGSVAQELTRDEGRQYLKDGGNGLAGIVMIRNKR